MPDAVLQPAPVRMNSRACKSMNCRSCALVASTVAAAAAGDTSLDCRRIVLSLMAAASIVSAPPLHESAGRPVPIRRKLFTGNQAPAAPVHLRKPGVAVETGVNTGDVQAVGVRQRRGIDLGTADHHQLHRLSIGGQGPRLLQ